MVDYDNRGEYNDRLKIGTTLKSLIEHKTSFSKKKMAFLKIIYGFSKPRFS